MTHPVLDISVSPLRQRLSKLVSAYDQSVEAMERVVAEWR